MLWDAMRQGQAARATPVGRGCGGGVTYHRARLRRTILVAARDRSPLVYHILQIFEVSSLHTYTTSLPEELLPYHTILLFSCRTCTSPDGGRRSGERGSLGRMRFCRI
eukprot:2389043-Pleurochrysis_carterae.AAC.3